MCHFGIFPQSISQCATHCFREDGAGKDLKLVLGSLPLKAGRAGVQIVRSLQE